MTAAGLTRRDLDKAQCSVPGCDHTAHAGEGLFLSARCHPMAPLRVFYRDGVLECACAECGEHIVNIVVAQGWH